MAQNEPSSANPPVDEEEDFDSLALVEEANALLAAVELEDQQTEELDVVHNDIRNLSKSITALKCLLQLQASVDQRKTLLQNSGLPSSFDPEMLSAMTESQELTGNVVFKNVKLEQSEDLSSMIAQTSATLETLEKITELGVPDLLKLTGEATALEEKLETSVNNVKRLQRLEKQAKSHQRSLEISLELANMKKSLLP